MASVRFSALEAFCDSSRRTASVRACATRISATWASDWVSCSRMRSWAASLPVSVTAMVNHPFEMAYVGDV